MNNKEKASFWKKRSAAVAVVICFVAVIAGIGTYTFRNSEDKIKQQVKNAQEETKGTEEKSQSVGTSDIVLPEQEANTSDTEEDTDENAADNNEDALQETETSASTYNVWFDENSLLEWPASGATLIGYSMDQTVYFPTLDQYKLSPAIAVQAAEGAPVTAAARGTVYSIEENPQTGTTLTMELGGGYQAVYGQLKDLCVEEGDTIEEGSVLGYINETTKYYSKEGSNLYFAMKKDGKPIDPIAYLP